MPDSRSSGAPPGLRSFVENVAFPCAALDATLHVVAHNERWVQAYHLDGSVIGRHHFDVFPELPQRWRDALDDAMAGTARASDRDTFYRADGRVQHIRWSLTPWMDDAGVVQGVVITSEDITDTLENERRLEESEGLIQAFFENSPIGLNLCRTSGLWLRSNAAFLDIIGYSAEEADGGLTYWDLTPRRYDEQEAEQLRQLDETGRYGPYEKEFVRKDGSLVPVRLNGFLVERDGERFIWSLIEDITTQRALEAEVEQQRLRALQASKLATLGEMAAGFAHEVNNPLAIIDAYAYTLDNAVQRGDLSEVGEAADAIREAVHRAATIITGLRRLSRNEPGPATRAEDVAAITSDALDLCSARLRNHGVRLDVDVRSAGRARVHAVELSQVVLNLVNNAFDAVRERPAREVKVETWDSEGAVCIAVEDTGGPLPEDVRERLFEPFFTTKRVGEGTGLGLCISRSILEAVGGTLELDARSSRTRFVVTLPVAA
ncbi:MAG: PAS domain S-box protein [Alphaproteobacteria bacterium]|nr:PAS domain S-box protein [Alphaproteobacteria bacterium]